MPAEEPLQSEHKIVFEIDYSHFTSFHGWIQLLQLVRNSYEILTRLAMNDWKELWETAFMKS